MAREVVDLQVGCGHSYSLLHLPLLMQGFQSTDFSFTSAVTLVEEGKTEWKVPCSTLPPVLTAVIKRKRQVKEEWWCFTSKGTLQWEFQRPDKAYPCILMGKADRGAVGPPAPQSEYESWFSFSLLVEQRGSIISFWDPVCQSSSVPHGSCGQLGQKQRTEIHAETTSVLNRVKENLKLILM